MAPPPRVSDLAGVLPAHQAAALAAVVHVYNREGRVVITDVMAEVDRARASVYVALRALEARGLIGWERGTNGTMRPLLWPVEIQA